MNKNTLFSLVLSVCTVSAGVVAADTNGRTDGLIVCIGEQALERTSGEWDQPGRVFHCLVTSDTQVEALRRRIAASGRHGKVSVARFDGRHLPYINNLINRIVIAKAHCALPTDEIQRVLAPYGSAIAPRGSSCLPRCSTQKSKMGPK